MQSCIYDAIMAINFHKLIISNKAQFTFQTVLKTKIEMGTPFKRYIATAFKKISKFTFHLNSKLFVKL